jgi:hypothetical protein
MKRFNYLKIIPLILTLLIFQRSLVTGEILYHQSNSSYISDTTLKAKGNLKPIDNSSIADSTKKSKISSKTILDVLDGIDSTKNIISWKLTPKTFDLEVTEGVDTSLYFPHLIIPNQKRLESITSLGNMGAPIQADHFFNRNKDYSFLFSRNYIDYKLGVSDHKHYKVKKPLTLISYSMGGGTSKAEQTLRVLHTQNVNKYFNVGLTYDYFGTKGMYKYQLTKDNLFTFFTSYYRDKFSFQGTFSYSRLRNQENGGLLDDKYIQDTTIESTLVPFKLKGASNDLRQRSISGIVGYAIINRWVKSKDKDGNQILVKKPVFSIKAMFETNKNSKVYVDSDADTSYYTNFYVNKGATRDSTMLLTYESTILGEIDQIAKFPGLPGLRFWITNTRGKYYYYKPGDFIFSRSDSKLETNHFGVGVYSYSPYLSYSGSLRMYVNGYRSEDKELYGQLVISPWKSVEYPYIKARIEISDKEPDLFMKNYFSNHFKWDNNFVKEKWFLLGGSIGADKWKFEAGYNLARINNYVYFDTTGVPQQASGVTITSAFVQKEFKLGGIRFTNRVVWQANTNKDVLSLPTFMVFSAISYEYELVKNVLVGRIGANVFFRTKFYADAYSPSTGQFYNQNEKLIGNYPIVDAFIDLKWKRAVIFFKLDHINQGIPNNEYYSTIHYPLNPMVLKIGVSWIFYD